MDKREQYYLVDKKVLPTIFQKVIKVKKLLSAEPSKGINEATQTVGISRGAYYKYKDHIFPFYESSRGRVITLFFVVEDFAGILSNIIMCIAMGKGNILTINQNIPINNLADVTIAIETDEMVRSIDDLMEEISNIKGVRNQKILARE